MAQTKRIERKANVSTMTGNILGRVEGNTLILTVIQGVHSADSNLAVPAIAELRNFLSGALNDIRRREQDG